MASELWTDGESKYTFEEVLEDVKDFNGSIFVGTDSQLHTRRRIFTCVICLYNEEMKKGGRYYYQRVSRPAPPRENLMNQLSEETNKALELASMIQEYHPNVRMEIHLDCSPSDAGASSSRYADMLQGWVASMGFDCKIKPDGWAACSIADRHSK